MVATRKRYFLLVDGSGHTECFGESTLCIGVLFHFERGVKMFLLGQSQNQDFSILGTTYKDEFERKSRY